MPYAIARMEANPARAIGGRIDFQTFFRNPGRRMALTDVRAIIHLKRPNGDLVTLGWAHATGQPMHWEVARNGGEFIANLTFLLSASALREIEELRGSQKVRFHFGFVLVGIPFEGEIHDAPTPREELQYDFEIGKSDWVETYLPVFGFGSHELLELRLPMLAVPESLQREADLIKAAVSDYNRGEYEDAFADCRKLVESLQVREKELALETAVGSEEWKRLRDYLSIALHSDDKIPKRIVRSDAEVALRLAQAGFVRVAASIGSPKHHPVPTPAAR